MRDLNGKSRLSSALALMALAVLQTGATVAQQGEQFAGTTDVLLVEVPVQVLLKGEPVTGLTADNFELRDEKRRQRILSVDSIDLRQIEGGGFRTAEETQPLPTAAKRNFLLLFDLSFSDPATIVRAREGAAGLVRDSLHPADLVAVATWAQSTGPRMVLNFTSDRGQVLRAIDTLGVADPTDRVGDPLRLARDSLGLPGSMGSGMAPLPVQAAGGIMVDVLKVALNDLKGLGSHDSLAQKQGQIASFMDGMSRVAGWLRSVPGRVHVALLSEGFDSTALMGISQNDETRLAEISQAAMDGQFWKVVSEERFGNQAALFGVTHALEEFRRADATIQAIDIGGLRTDVGVTVGGPASVRDAPIRQESLFLMADQTGGQLYRNYNDLGEAMGELLEQTSVTYVLAFQPDEVGPAGTYHQLKVKVKGGPKGAQVVHRPGYYVPGPYGAADGEERRIRNASLLLSGHEGGSIQVRSLAVPLPSGGDRTPVGVLLEIDGPSLMQGSEPPTVPVEVYGYALDEEGRIRDYFGRAMGLDLNRSGSLLRRSGLKFWGDFELDPGRYTLRILVRNSAVGSIHTESLELEVPQEPAAALLLPPLIPDASGSWVFAREKAGSASLPTSPFSYAGQRFLPALRPDLVTDADNALSLMVYGLEVDGLTATAELRELSGAAVGTVDLKISGHEPGGGNALQLTALVSPSAVPPGPYDLHVRLAGGSVEAASSLPVQVVGGLE